MSMWQALSGQGERTQTGKDILLECLSATCLQVDTSVTVDGSRLGERAERGARSAEVERSRFGKRASGEQRATVR